jgi:hypothetical protein
MKLIKTLVVAIAGLVLAAATSHATLLIDGLGTVTLGQLTGANAGNTIQVGDKIFGNFTWAGPASASSINISTIGDGTANNLYGIQIGGPLFAINTVNDFQLGYSVTIAPGYANLISDLHQFANLSGAPGSFIDITESVLNAPGGNQVGVSHLNLGLSLNDPADPPAEANDELIIGTYDNTGHLIQATPLSQIWISKDILLVGNPNAASTIIQQRFSQVPEPTTMIAGALLLLPFGASTIRILRKNRTA